MQNKQKVSHNQLRASLVATIIGVGIISLPNELATIQGKDGWILIFMTGFLLVPVFWMIHYIFKINPGKDYFQIGDQTLGSFVFSLCKLVFLAYQIVYCAFIIRSLSELIKAFLLHKTPIGAVIFLLILAGVYISSKEIEVIVRAGYVVYPIILIFVATFFLISLPTADITNILPMFQSDFSTLAPGIRASFFSFTGFEIMLFVIPYVDQQKKALKSSLLALGTVTMIYLILFFTSLSHFHLRQLQDQNYSLLMIAKIVDLPGYFLQNLDGIFMGLWILIVFTSFIASFFGAGKVVSSIFKTKRHRSFIWGLAPLIYFISLIPNDYIELQVAMMGVYNLLGFLSIIIVPFLIFLVGLIKRRGRL